MTNIRTDSSGSPLGVHATDVHEGFPRTDEGFEELRAQRVALIRRFLAAMDEAGRPGVSTKLGSTVLKLTGQRPGYFWSTMIADDGREREVLVFDDGTHGWSDEVTYSDRPRTPADEIEPDVLEQALTQILTEHGLTWPDETPDET